MKRYRFRLEAVLRARRAQEDMARQELARANRHLQAANDRHEGELARYRAVPPPGGLVDVATETSERLHRELVATAVHEAGRRREDLAVAAAVQHAAWREAAQRVAALERLDDRRRADHAQDLSRAEAAEVDDLVTSRFVPEGPRPVAAGERDRARHGVAAERSAWTVVVGGAGGASADAATGTGGTGAGSAAGTPRSEGGR